MTNDNSQIEELELEISNLKAQIFRAEMCDNSYANSGRMKADSERLTALKGQLENLQRDAA